MQVVPFLSSVLFLKEFFSHEFSLFFFFLNKGQVASTCNSVNVVLKADVYTADLDGFYPSKFIRAP